MENIFKISKRVIIAILTLCILLCTAGIGVHATSIAEETTVATEVTTVTTEGTTVVTEATTVVLEDTTAVAAVETTQELMPMMARSCGNDYDTFHDLLDAYNIGYTGNANHTVLGSGYSYTYTKSGTYWSIYLEGPSGPIGLFRVGSM